MPGGKGNISGTEGNTFSCNNQPRNRRKPDAPLNKLLRKILKEKKRIVVEVELISTGEKVKGHLPMPNVEVIVQALLRQAVKGNVNAIREVFDRIEGRVPNRINGDIKGNVNPADYQDIFLDYGPPVEIVFR